MGKFETRPSKPIGESFTAQDFLRALPVINANGTVKETPIFFGGGGDTKEYVGSNITNCRPLRVCKISGQSVTRATCNFFPKSRWPQWKRSIMACHMGSLQTNGDKLL